MTHARQEHHQPESAVVTTEPQPILHTPHTPHEALSEQDKLNFASRWLENARYIGGIPQAAILYTSQDQIDFDNESEVSYEMQVGSLTGLGSGLLVGAILHIFFRDKYIKRDSLNPLYRNFKTLASFGSSIGMSAAKILPIPASAQNFFGMIIADVLSLSFGFFALPYWLIREYLLQTPRSKRNVYARTGLEGWSKYSKTFLVFGGYLGQVAGAIYSQVAHTNLVTTMAIAGGIASVGSFVAGMILVPTINYLFKNALVANSKDSFRNNYVRTGITLGVALGTTIGFVLGSIVFPGLGSMIGMTLGGAIGSVVGGFTLGAAGSKISHFIQKNWNVREDTDNSWDYATRNTAYLLGFLGSAIGFFVPVPGGALMGAAIGASIGGVIGWATGLGVVRAARILTEGEPELKAKTLPWTQRVATGANIGSIIGGGIGFFAGFCLGPLGALGGAALGFAIGGFVGGIAGALFDKRARNCFSRLFSRKKTTVVDVVVEKNLKSTNDILREKLVTPATTETVEKLREEPLSPTKPDPLYPLVEADVINNQAQLDDLITPGPFNNDITTPLLIHNKNTNKPGIQSSSLPSISNNSFAFFSHKNKIKNNHAAITKEAAAKMKWEPRSYQPRELVGYN